MFPIEIFEILYQFSDIDTKIELSKIYGNYCKCYFKPIKIKYDKKNISKIIKIRKYKNDYSLVIKALSNL